MAIIKNKNTRAVFCADDYGIAPGVSAAIETLLAAGRLTATSAMTLLPGWRARAMQLKTLRDSGGSSFAANAGFDVGVHLTLTDHAPLTQNSQMRSQLAVRGKMPALRWLLVASYTRALNVDVVRAEIRAQLDAFEDAWGAPPDFVDGHQHVHLLPGVREALMEEILKRYKSKNIYVRNCVEPTLVCIKRGIGARKALLLSAMGRGFARLAQNAGIAMNVGFSGIHDFADVDFRPRMQRFLRDTGARPLIHVHPGHVDDALKKIDSLTTPREREFSYLSSDAFIEDLANAGIAPSRFRLI